MCAMHVPLPLAQLCPQRCTLGSGLELCTLLLLSERTRVVWLQMQTLCKLNVVGLLFLAVALST